MKRLLARRSFTVLAVGLGLFLGGCGFLGNKAPVAEFSYQLDRDSVPATLTLDATASTDPDGIVDSYHWDIAGSVRIGATTTVVLPTAGDYLVTLTVTDDKGDTDTASVNLTIKEAQPDVVPPLPASLDLEARVDQFAVASFTLGNVGSLGLDVTVTSDAWIAVVPTATTVAASSLKDFVVTATCSSTAETLSGSIDLVTNDPDEANITVPVTLECTVPPPSDFTIQVVFAPGTITLSQQAIFVQAAARWAEVIIGDLPDVASVTQGETDSCAGGFTFTGNVDDLVILARTTAIDGPGGVLGSAGPCKLRGAGASYLPWMGRMNFDSADVDAMEANGSLLGVIMHEMGHVLNLSSYGWDNILGVLDYDTAACLDADAVTYSGANGVARWNALGGVGDVPVEENGVPGTGCSHWDEETFADELMTGYIALTTSLS
ncbi:MAG TPA: PKD domain-containing protein, partial [Trueperaceae bacterium]|nr:PKD domain-containing protein [Trueperaceae bacterium]